MALGRDERELAHTDVEMAAVIQQAVRRASSRAQDHTFDVENAGWSVRGDAGALERVVLNLLDNALKFPRPGP